jgi:hypothetical protein
MNRVQSYISYDLHRDLNSSSFDPIYCIAIIITINQMLVWITLLVTDQRALGQDFTELVHMDILKLIHIS